MISKMEMINYKCFAKNEIKFSEMTILAGANAAGKSSIIQALLLFYGSLKNSDKKTDVIDVSNALRIQVGGPKSLVAQNPVELENADFKLSIYDGQNWSVINYKIDMLSPLKLIAEKEEISTMNEVFYLNAERMGPRISYAAGIDDKIVSDGSNAAYLMDRADMAGRKIHESLALNGQASKFSIHVEEWINAILGDVSFSLSTDLIKATTDIKYLNSMVNQEILPTMTGFGISYILSIVTAGLWCSCLEGAVLVIENPEAHLHPYSQSQMGKFLMLLTNAGVQVIVETHSEHIIDGARIQAACMQRTNQMCVNFLSAEENQIKIKEIEVSETGELREWPVGFFDQKSQDLRELFKMRKQNAN